MFLLISYALAVIPIGLTTIPEQPGDMTPTWAHKEAIEQIVAGKIKPKSLIPNNYIHKGQVNLWAKHYDEKKQVYRFSEVIALLETRETSRSCLVDYDHHMRIGTVWNIVSCVTLPIFPFNLLFSIPAGLQYRQAREAFVDALVAYNEKKK